MPRSAVLSPNKRNDLLDALGEAQRIGMLGAASLDQVVDRSLDFVASVPEHAESVVDLGSGGGDPGLVIAVADPTLQVTLVDRRQKRCDLLTRLVGRLGVESSTEVVTADVADLPRLFPGRRWDVATSRGFGPPDYTARHAAPLLGPGGLLVVSEPPGSRGERWEGIADFSVQGVVGGVVVLVRN
jgi:16S rRNA (guanine527-N7)-methyltransferase